MLYSSNPNRPLPSHSVMRMIVWVHILYILCSNSGVQCFQQLRQLALSRRALPLADTAQHAKYSETAELSLSKIKIGGNRFAVPGDYVVHEDYGIGRYLGVRHVDITPAQRKENLHATVVVQFADVQISWFQIYAASELWMYRSKESGDQQLSLVADPRKWEKRKEQAALQSAGLAVNLINLMALRNGMHRTPCLPPSSKYRDFETAFTHKPTIDQAQCFNDILIDMVDKTRPMDRLICGDVGFGKTEVAMRAMYLAVLSKKQVALLAPTKILANQHLQVISNRMPDVRVELLCGGGEAKLARKLKDNLKSGQCQVVVGTHALLHASVQFQNLGLLIIDEEQRFGVKQKEKLVASANGGVDVLRLSATPIPRTLQMSLSGFKDFSQMVTAPVGRKEVNISVGLLDMDLLCRAITFECNRGGQAFVVVPFIADISPVKTMLSERLPSLRYFEVHGNMTGDAMMDQILAFTNKEGDVLIATTVIENGIDMPNVNTIAVLSCDRFGMSQLYQLRGRVGRSPTQAYAYFMYNKTCVTIEAENRLTYLKTFTALGSGYDLSMRDMEMRGSGSIFGSEQSGSDDIGVDLQAKMLAKALERMTKDFILPVPETRVAIGSAVELIGTARLGNLPARDDPTAVARWEARLAELLVGKAFGEMVTAKSAVAVVSEAVAAGAGAGAHTEQGLSGSVEARVKKTRVKQKDLRVQALDMDASPHPGSIEFSQGNDGAGLEDDGGSKALSEIPKEEDEEEGEVTASSYSDASQPLQEFLASSSLQSLTDLEAKWNRLLSDGMPVYLIELLRRAQVRVAARRLGIEEIVAAPVEAAGGADLVMWSRNIDLRKWGDLSIAVPQDLQDRVVFKSEQVVQPAYVDEEGEEHPEQSYSIGVIVCRQGYDSDSLASKRMPRCLIDLIVPLGLEAQSSLDYALRAGEDGETVAEANNSLHVKEKKKGRKKVSA